MTECGEDQHQTTKQGPISPLSARPHSCTKTRQTLVLKKKNYILQNRGGSSTLQSG